MLYASKTFVKYLINLISQSISDIKKEDINAGILKLKEVKMELNKFITSSD